MTVLRRLVAISLVVFGVAVFYVLLAGLSSNPSSGGGSSRLPTAARTPGQPTETSTAVAETPGQPTQTGSTTISAQEVATHNSRSDCWIIVSNKVYNVSSYIGSHPGGASTITPYCGKDATQAFETKDLSRSQDHSSRAYNHLDTIYVGDLAG
jgi:cytochrome b involved in lipid metabolism